MSDPLRGSSRQRVAHMRGDPLLGSLARGTWMSLTAFAVSAAVSAAAALALPAALAAAVNAVLAGAGVPDAALRLALVLALVTCAQMASAMAGTLSTTSATATLRLRFVSHLLSLGVGDARRWPAGELTTRLVSNAVTAGRAPATLVNTAVETLTAVGCVVALFLIDWRVGLAFLTGVPVATVVMRLFAAQVSGVYADYQGAQGRLAARLTEVLAGIRTVRASGSADREVTRVLGPLPDLSRAGHALWRAQARGMWRITLLLPLIEVAVLAVTGFGVAEGRLEPGHLLAAAGYAALGLASIDQMDVLANLAHARSAARRVHDVLALPPLVTGTRPLPDGPGALSFRGVTVTREGLPLLDDVDLDIPPGALTALVGRAGAGKSTVALLAGRLMDPDHGEVLLDGRPLEEIDAGALRSAVAYAFERPVLLGGTIASAIAYGLPPTGHDAGDVRAAARAAQIDDVVRRLPRGYDTPADAAPLSGGEFQRLGLARALVRRARLTILDDATSSLDTATEAQVTRTLVERMRGRTRLVVAHRAATAARADLVVWLESGRIRARGTHQALWRDPAYRALFGAGTAPGTDSEPGAVPEPAGDTFQEESCPARP